MENGKWKMENGKWEDEKTVSKSFSKVAQFVILILVLEKICAYKSSC